MAHHYLDSYLNDHLAGATVALELVDQIRLVDADGDWIARIGAAIREDREQLEHLMDTAGIARSGLRQGMAWASEKLMDIKTRFEDTREGPLRRLEMLEALSLGIEGKRSLWTALQRCADHVTALRGINYPRLLERAEDQRRIVENHRLLAAAEAFRDPIPATSTSRSSDGR